MPVLLARRAQASPSGTALLAPGRRPLSYAALADQVQRVGGQLRALGIGRGDRVALVLPNGPEAAVAFLAVAGVATAAPLNPAYQAKEFTFYLQDLDARAVLIAAGARSPVREVAAELGIPLVEVARDGDEAGAFTLVGAGSGAGQKAEAVRPDDVALVLHTSGTTSRPKIVPLTHANVLASAAHIGQTLRLTPADRCLNVQVLFHIHGLMAALLASLAAGGSVVCTPGFLAPRFYDWLAEFKPTWYTAVPTIHQTVLARAEGQAAIIAATPFRFIRSSSASLAPSVMAALEATFRVPVVEAYGMTEAAHQMTSNPLPPAARKPGTVGPAAGPEVAIMDLEEPRLLAPGERGEIVIRGPNVTRGYANNPAANDAAFAGGWFRTGDEGFFDDEGYLTISGRLKEIINRGGEKIAPREIDEVLLAHTAVRQAVAFAIPNPLFGEEVGAAVIVEEPTVTPQALRRHVAAQLAPFKIPHQIIFVDEIPKGPTGKLQRIGLAERLGVTAREGLAGGGEVTYVAPEGTLEETLAALWTEVLALTRVGATQPFLDSGGDSMTAAQLVTRIQETFKLPFGVAELLEAPTVRAQAAVVAELKRGTGDRGRKRRSLRRLKSGDAERLPLFLVPGGGGGEAEFLAYARLISGLENRVYGFYGRGQGDGRAPHQSVAAMADDYVAEMRAVQPEGPYLLAGECIGGHVAYEMALRLEAAGEAVHLILLNTHFAGARGTSGSGGYWRGQAKHHWQQLRQGSLWQRWRYVRQTVAKSPLNPGQHTRGDYGAKRRRLRARVHYRQTVAAQRPSAPTRQPISVISAQDDGANAGSEILSMVARGGVSQWLVPGDRESYLGTHVATTLAALRQVIEQIERGQWQQEDGR